MLNATWSAPAHWPELRAGEVQVWLAELSAARAQSGDFAAVLSPEEQARAGRFRATLHRERWVTSRGILRMALARCLGVKPSRIEFDYNELGKPALRTPAAPGFHFNLSHSGDYAAFAFTRVGAVGVDIESVRVGMPQMEDIARRYFAPGESAALLALPTTERARAFFQLWTCKEAFVKARGTGLFSGLNRFEVEVQSSRLLTLDGVPAHGWWMAALPESSAIAGGLVVAAATCSPSFLRWSERFCT